MGTELDLMRLYPVAPNRLAERPNVSDEDRTIARQFGYDYFDGNRRYGYGGFHYHPRFWCETVALFAEHYALGADSRVLDVGCAKGFMLRDLCELVPGIGVAGIDISPYAIEHADPQVAANLMVGDARKLPFDGSCFDLVVSINTLHNLERSDCIQAIAEIERVSRGKSFIMVDGWRTPREREMLEAWVLTAVTMLPASQWVTLFEEAGYTGDYAFWTVD